MSRLEAPYYAHLIMQRLRIGSAQQAVKILPSLPISMEPLDSVTDVCS
jgi:hypothetical protein